MHDYRVMDRVDPRTEQFRLTVSLDDSGGATLEDTVGNDFTFGVANPSNRYYVREVPEVAEGDRLFWVDVHDHGQVQYYLTGYHFGDLWDTARRGAFIIIHADAGWNMDGAEGIARSILEGITSWANGDVYWYRIEDLTGTTVEECGNVLGGSIEDVILDACQGLNIVEVGGDASYLIEI